jgi:site-specific recombinase XerD
MDVVYLFYEPGAIRIPLFERDQKLYYSLANRGGGKWDFMRREFTFKRNGNADGGWNFQAPYVKVGEDFSGQVKVYGFFGQGGGAGAIAPKEKQPEKAAETAAADWRPPLPEKFSEYWHGRLDAEMRARKFSLKTKKIYVYFNRLMCQALQKTPEEISDSLMRGGDDATQFLAALDKEKDFSASSLNLALSAVKFFYKNVMKSYKICEQPRPNRDKMLPSVLSKEEIKQILDSERNPKHRLLLMLAYSSGLRVSEVVALKKEHIDFSRQVVHVKMGKGRKDRSTLLSEKSVQYIEEYCESRNIETWVFPGQVANRPLTIRSAQRIFDKAAANAGVKKDVSIHSLRHTFATHLLESGTDIRYIQELLGHTSIKTTERYTHVARRVVLKIASPLDSIL